MNLDQILIVREGLTIFDVLADIGGFNEVLGGTSALIVLFFDYKYLESILVSKLFRMKAKVG